MKLYSNSSKIFGLLTAIIFLMFTTLITYAQVVGPDHYENVIRVKLEESASKRVSVSSENGVALSGITSIDRLNRQFNAVTIKRVFSDGGKFKARREAFGLFRWYEIRFEGKVQVAELVSAYANDSNVEIAEPIYKKSFNQEGGKDLNFTPNDPQYPNQYNWNNTGQTGGTPGADVSAPEAWNIQSGDPSVIISSHDTGIDTDHPELSGILWTNPNPDPVMNDLHGYNFANGNSNIYDSDGHGSHTSGTVAATNNNGIGVSGLAGGNGSGNGVRIMVCKVFGDGGVQGGFAESFPYAADHGAVISTNSWGYTAPGNYEQAVLDGIDYFIANAGYDEVGNPVGPVLGGIVVFAAGNDGTDDEWYPAYYEPVYAVAGTNHFDRLIRNGVDGSWFGSNYGEWVDISAPGMFIISTVIDGYDTYSGTSMACPHVAAAAGLVASQYPGLTNDEVMLRVIGTADPIDDLNPGYEGKLGSGRLNAYAALIEDDGQPPEAITDLSITAMGQTTAGLQWTVPPASTAGGESINAAPALYDIRYSESPINNDTDFENATQVADPPIPLAPGEIQSYTVTGLIPLTTYYFAIKSQDLFGNKSGMSNVVSGTTEGAPILATNPTELYQEVETNTQETGILTLSNIGEGTLEWSFAGYSALGILNDVKIKKNVMSQFTPQELAKDQADTRVGNPVVLGAGGPDNYGYTWIDSDESGGPIFNWIDISEIGTELTEITGTDDGREQVDLPFEFNYYDTIVTQAYVSANGWVYFGTSPSGWWTNNTLPSTTYPALFAIFWDDLDLRTHGNVYTYYDAAANIFIIQWNNVQKRDETSSSMTFEMILSPEGGFTYQYLTMDGTLTSATVGFENLAGNDGLTIAHNTNYIEDNFAIKINTPWPSWLSVSPASGSLADGESVDVTLTYDATGLLAGIEYVDELPIASNDPSKPLHKIPITMVVTGGNPQIAVSDDTVDFGTIIQGTSKSLPFMIYNVGAGAALAVSDIQTDNPAFTVNETTLSIMPSDSAEVTLTFTADNVGTYNGTMTISSNDATDPNYHVALTGIGGSAPIVGTDPTEFVKTQEAGTVTTETLTIQNTGGSDLLFSINIENNGSSLEYSIPASDGNFHRINSQKSIGQAPRNGNPIEEVAGPTVELNQLEEATYYGVNYGSSTDFVSFQGNVPEELNIIGPYGGANFSNAGDYPLGEDSFVYELDNAGDLRTIDVATGEATLLGNIGSIGDGWTGMATDPTDGTIYISTGTGLATLDVDGLSYSTIGSWSVSYMIGIAIDNEGVMYGYDLETAMLYSINKETAAITAIGSIGFDPNYGQGLTYDTQHDLLVMVAFNNTTFAAEFRLVDPTTGNTELIGVLGETIPGGTNQLGWIAAPISATPDWLVANPVEGTVAPGGTFDVELTFNATELIGNVDYYANVNVESNDPVTPVHVVPVTLSTTGTPQIAVDPTSLDFGDVFLGTSKDLTFTVTNNGNAVLNVSGISIGNEAYTADPDSFILLPANSKVVTVTFTPTSLGDYGTTLTIVNDDVNVNIAITATCVPFLTASVDEFNETLEAGQTVTRTLTITNEYNENLPFSIYIKGVNASVEPTFYPSNLSDVELLKWFDLAKNPKSDNPNKIVSAGKDLESLSGGSTKTDSTRFPFKRLLGETNVSAYAMDLLDDILVSFDAGVPEDVITEADGFTTYAGNFTKGDTKNIFIAYQDTLLVKYNIDDNTYTEVASFSFENEGEFFTDFTADYTTGELYGTTSADDGISRLYRVNKFTGEMELIGTYPDYLLIAIAADDMGELYGHDIQNDLIVKINKETGELTEVGPTGINANYAQSMTFDQTTRQLLMAAYNIDNAYGERNELRFVNRTTGATTLIGKFYGDGSGEMDAFTTQGEGFLSVNLVSGTLPPGVSLDLNVKFDATNLYAGDYQAAISIVGEQLQGQPSVEIPAYLTVTGVPELAYSTDELTFDSVFVNDTSQAKFVTIRNEGTAMLHITSAILDNEDYIVYQYGFLSDTLLTLEPGEPVVFGFFFAPTSVGTSTGTFALVTDGGNYTLSLTGEGIPAPVLEMSVDSLVHQAYPGQQQLYSMTMSNTGGNPLEYSMVVGTMAGTSSQSVILLEEGFEGDFLPDGWSSYSQGDPGYAWQQTSTRAHSGSYSAYHDYYFVDIDDWLVTPQLALSGNSTLQFYDYTAWPTYYVYSGVWISTGSPDPADGDYVELAEFDDAASVWTNRVIDLSAYADSNVYIAFVYQGNNAHEWYIDDVTVSYELNWLNITSPTEGILEPGVSSEITLAVDATGLSGGVYQSGIILSTNDPLHRVEYIPFTLTVVEALTVRAIPDEEDEILHPNEEFILPITVTSMDDLEVYSYQFTLNYDSQLLNAIEIITDSTLSEGLVLETNIEVPGTISVAAIEPIPERASDGAGLFSIEGEGTLMYVKFKAKEALGDSSFSFSEVLFNEGTPGASSIGGNYSVQVLYGDANLDVNVSSFDATTILKNVVGLIELNEVAIISADVSGAASVTAFDAALVLHYVAGLIDEFPVESANSTIAKIGKNVKANDVADINSSNSSKKKNEKATISSVSNASVVLSKAMNNGEPDMMSIPIELNDADNVYSISIRLKYDEKLINVEDVRAKLPKSWVIVFNDDESFVNIAMAGTEPLPSGSFGTLVVKTKDPTEIANITGEVTINESATSTLDLDLKSIPYNYDLAQNYPNPFNPSTTIKYQIPEKARVSLVVYNQLGQVVKTLVNDEEQDAGYYEVVWKGDNNFGGKVASGVYIVRMNTESFVSVKKMVFLK